jgi:hypothetical protein
MDDTNMGRSVERSAEEVAWDEEFNDTRRGNSAASTITNMARLAISVPTALMRMPMQILPRDTAQHARAATLESFLAVRSLMSAIGDRIEEALTDSGSTSAGVQGPAGTWGTARTTSTTATSATPSKAKRISIEETTVSAPDSAMGASGESEEGRGLRADIEY